MIFELNIRDVGLVFGGSDGDVPQDYLSCTGSSSCCCPVVDSDPRSQDGSCGCRRDVLCPSGNNYGGWGCTPLYFLPVSIFISCIIGAVEVAFYRCCTRTRS